MFEGSRPPISFCPRIYYLHPRLAGALVDWPRHFARIAGLGFDHVLLPLPATSGRSLWLIDDYERADPALGVDSDMNTVLARITAMAHEAGLSVLLDLVLDRVASDGRFARTHTDLLANDTRREPPDPRRSAAWLGATALRLDDLWVVSRALSECSARLQAWQDAGVDGFMLQSPHRLPSEFTTLLIAGSKAHRQCRFIASALGVSWDEHAKLRDLGYESVLGSAANWDFRADWMLEEHRSLSTIAAVITAPEIPFGPRVAASERQPVHCARAAQRRLRLAVGSGCGWLMPIGFEYGVRDPLPASGGSAQAIGDWQQQAPYDLSTDIRELNRWLGTQDLLQQPAKLVALNSAGQGFSALLRTRTDPRDAETGLMLITNVDLTADVDLLAAQLLGANAGGLSTLQSSEDGSAVALDASMHLDAGELQYLRLTRPLPVLAPAIASNPDVIESALEQPRVTIEAISPSVDGGEHAVKRVIGDIVHVEVDAFMDGHDSVAVALLWRPADENRWREVRMRALGNDRWAGEFPLERIGRYQYTVQAWRDDWASYRHEIEKKHAAGLKISVELDEGRQKIEAAAQASEDAALSARLLAITASLAAANDEQRYQRLSADDSAQAMQLADTRPFAATYEPALILESEPTMAGFASWYELFPRSMSDDPAKHGTLRDVIAQLPRIRDMGFDVLYFPPIHPIGQKHRKGRNNSLTATADDPGSPYAIGSAEGGFDAIDSRLGTLEDFRVLHDAAREQGLQLALDFAVQCSPDHPWLKDHPDWFAWRPDGTIKYAENPPKKYEDIVNVDFYAEGAMPGLWLALRDAVLFWCKEGVRCFRVDNPHTKPLPFWKWMIADVRGRYPDAVFLAEAFTRPKLMRRLAKIGYSQSYTYFTWRNSKAELTEYLTELTQTEMREYFRPHFFVNTPDINPLFLQSSGRAGFIIRAALAATLSGLWGMYSGFELCEAAALPNKEEYLDSEKYQLRAWDWRQPGHITREITLLNRLRRQHPALQTHLGLSFLKAWNDKVLLYCKTTADRSDVLLIAVSLDPHNAQETDFEIPLWDFGLPDHAAIAVEDRISGARFTWQGKVQHLRLTPEQPFSIWRLSPA